MYYINKGKDLILSYTASKWCTSGTLGPLRSMQRIIFRHKMCPIDISKLHWEHLNGSIDFHLTQIVPQKSLALIYRCPRSYRGCQTKHWGKIIPLGLVV